ncbi:aspartyl-trna synthetase [Rhodobacteraceae bacterium WD3A24]|nr:aspartyl-trna synthetase [Rhodobacteraceae bacterium WD3A24]
MTSSRTIALAALLALLMAAAAGAQERGPVTNLPLPRYVSLKATEGNARRGPGLEHRVDWVFTRRGMPLMVTAEYGHWRRVQDREGATGWVHYALLSGARTVIVEQDMTPLRLQADARAPINAYLEAGVVARVDECGPDWCRLEARGEGGWAERATLWGLMPDERLD